MEKSKRSKILMWILVVSLSWVFLSVEIGFGESFPNRPLALIVRYGAGGSTDVLTRAISAVAEKKLGRPVIIVNRPGGGGINGLVELARSKPDGYTLGVIGAGAVTVTPLMEKVPYNADDFVYICGFTAWTYGIFVKANSQFKTLGDVVKEARLHPGKITYGAINEWTQLAFKAVEIKENIKMTYVPFRGGAEVAANILGGHIDVGVLSTDAHQFLASKDIKMLASAAPKRWAAVPDAPTMKELGYDVDITAWSAIAAPAGLPMDRLNILYEAFKAGHADPGVRSLFDKLYGTAPYTSGKEIKQLFMKKQAEVKPLIEVLKAANKK